MLITFNFVPCCFSAGEGFVRWSQCIQDVRFTRGYINLKLKLKVSGQVFSFATTS
jgi:hypothetical protein